VIEASTIDGISASVRERRTPGEPTMGSLLHALDEAGVARENITTIALTHTHIDHASGLVTADGCDAFVRHLLRSNGIDSDPGSFGRLFFIATGPLE
jgi:glyoxylase-like metal-dependent hydrolase (beta-lactamase superfamily II)